MNKIISFLNKVPNGLYKMRDDFNDLVETSLNLGVVSLENSNNRSSNDFKALISFCSSKEDEKLIE